MNKLSQKIFISLLIFVSFSAGFVVNGFINSSDSKKKITGLVNLNIGSKNEIEKKADFDIFWDAWRIVEDKYNLEPLDYQEMVYGAIEGMVYSLRDPYTVFLDPEESEVFDEDMKGSFSGIGAEIGFRDKLLTVIAPLEDSPAENAGILSGDKILKVDGEEIFGMSIDKAVNLIRGEKGTKVLLTIAREGLDELKDIEIVRDTIIIKTIEWEIKENNIAYLKISQFKEDTTFELDDKIGEILAIDPRGIIIDLRNNAGGYVHTVKEVSGRFLDRGEVVFIEDHSDGETIHKATGDKRFFDVSIVVLINEGSASASEILAGALRDNMGVKLVGKKTFGKGSVQEVKYLKDGSSIKITVAEWLTPNRTVINNNGVEPDFEVEMSFEDYENDRDPQLEKAMELLIF
ncbi:MAG: S41 family peptidase [Candidatus Pacebacteria bacterium]|nr:S41 family peptidase [Candidatus Paceibacterota bacterium]